MNLIGVSRRARSGFTNEKPAASAAGESESVMFYLKYTVVFATAMMVIRMPLMKAGTQMLPVRL